MPYGRFVAYNVIGGVSWGAAVALLGYAFGSSYHLVERWLGRISLFLLILIVAGVLLFLLGRRLWARKERLGRLATEFADRVLNWRVSRLLSRYFGDEISWALKRFSPRGTYGLMLTTGLVVSAVLAWVFGAILEDVTSRDPIVAFDRVVAETLHTHAVPWLTRVIVVVTTFGSGWVLVPAAAVLAAVLFWRRRWADGLVLISATAGAAVLNAVLKLVIHRPRPEFLEPLAHAGGYSFPSGHAASSAAFYMTLGLLAAGWVRRWETRVYVLLGSIFVVALIGFSRHVLRRSLPERRSCRLRPRRVLGDHCDHHRGGAGPCPLSPPLFAGGSGHEGTQTCRRQVVLTGAGCRAGRREPAAAPCGRRSPPIALPRRIGGRGRRGGDGSGFYTNRVAAWTSGRVYAVELQAEMQEIHRRNGVPANVEMVLAGADELPLTAGSIDRALSINTFHETHGPEGLRRLAEALRPGGLFVIVDWRRSPDAAEYGPPLKYRLSTEEVRSTLAPWFDVVSEEVVSTPFFAIVARKK